MSYEIVVYTQHGREVIDFALTKEEAGALRLEYLITYRRSGIEVFVEEASDDYADELAEQEALRRGIG